MYKTNYMFQLWTILSYCKDLLLQEEKMHILVKGDLHEELGEKCSNECFNCVSSNSKFKTSYNVDHLCFNKELHCLEGEIVKTQK